MIVQNDLQSGASAQMHHEAERSSRVTQSDLEY